MSDREIAVYHSKEIEHFELAQRQAGAFASSTLIPEHMRTRENCLAAMMMADSMGEERLTVIRNVYFVHGNPGWKSEFMVARANRSGKLRGPLRWRDVGKDLANPAVECYGELIHGGADPRIALTVDYQTAVQSGWTSYKKDEKVLTHRRWDISAPLMVTQMLRWRSAAWLVRLYLPEIMLGLPTTEELEDISEREMVDVTPPPPPPKLEEFTAPKEQPPPPKRRGRPRLHNVEHRSEPSTTEPPELDPAPIEEPPDWRPAHAATDVLVPFDAHGNLQEWFGRARTRLREMSDEKLPPDRYAAFRKANYGAITLLKKEYRAYWGQLDGIIKRGEQ